MESEEGEESGRTGLEEGEELVDILEERRRGSDIGHALRTFNPQPYRGALPCSAEDLKTAVLDSQYLRYITKEMAVQTGCSEEEVREEAGGILEEMTHNMQLGFVRLMGFTLSKVFKRLFSSIHVNQEGLHRLQQAIQEFPVILMPNHRSYVDFLVISYIMFTYDLSIPVIAAGVPLSGMKIIGEILRRSGAFFIRRAIGSDKLYWAVLSEYVKTIVRRGYAPVEFYVEGLRSRTLKSLTPKLGMMHMVLEPFFKGEVYDITLVPMTISYDRVLEESLLAHELLGGPKPKETTAGLLKASSVLMEDYGSMHVIIGHPLSVRQLSQGRVDRSQYNLIPRDLPQKPSAQTQACVNWLAHLVVCIQEKSSVLSPWSLMACLVLQDPSTARGEEGLDWDQLTQKTLWLRELALGFGAHLNWPGQVSDTEVMSSSLALHHSVVCCTGGRVHLVEGEGSSGKCPISPEEGVARRAGAVLMVGSYRNQAMHVFIRPAMLVVAMRVTKSTQRDQLFSYFSFLQELFSSEFIFVPGRSSQDFEEACSLMRKCGAVRTSQQEVTETEAGLETTSFLQALLQPFIDAYEVVFNHLCDEEIKVFTERQCVTAVRSLANRLLLSGDLNSHEALSSDTQKNVLSALLRLGAVTKWMGVEKSEYSANGAAVRRIADILAGTIPPQMLRTAPDARL